MTHKKYLSHTWSDPHLIVKASSIEGEGIFTGRDIKKDEVVMIWGGVTIDRKTYDDSKYRPATIVPISDHKYLGLLADDTSFAIDEFLNHSCDPNVWLIDEVTVVARRDIKSGEEITLDCVTWNDDEEDYSDDGTCSCKSKDCRNNLKVDDWKIVSLQKRYSGHFSPFLEKRILQFKSQNRLKPHQSAK